jgi:hypothetical protein
MRRSLTACRTGVSVIAAVVLLSACGGSDGKDASSSASSSSSESSAPQADSTFCTEAASIQDRIDSTLDNQSDPTALPQALHEAAKEIRAIKPPAEIADDWAALAAGVDQIATAFGSIDINDPSALATFQQQIGQLQTDLATASSHVQKYLADQCGIEMTPSESASPTS